MTAILLTGATGLIGSRLVSELKTRPGISSIFCLVRNPNHPSVSHLQESHCQIINGDILDRSNLADAFSISKPDVVINCAGVLRSLERNLYFAVNRDAVKNISALALNNGAKVVHISSLAAYGPSLPGSQRHLLAESQKEDTIVPASPVSDYGRSKLEGNIALINSGARYTIVVPSAVYGPRDKDMFFFFKLASMGISISTPRRRTINLSYIDDVVKVITSCLDTATDGKTYYSASPEEYDWEGVCKVIAGVAGKKRITRLVLPDVAISVAAFLSEKISALVKRQAVAFNTDKAREMLSSAWVAGGSYIAEKELGVKFTNFADGAAKTYNWYKENHWI